MRRGDKAEAVFAARLMSLPQAASSASCPNCCLAWRQLSLGVPFMPPLITSAGMERDCYCHYSR